MRPDTPALRIYSLALLPLALAGLMPPWQVALLCALYALGVRFTEWATGRLLLSLLVVSLGLFVAGPAALSGGPEALLRVALTFLLHLWAVMVLHHGANWIENGARAGLLAPLVLGLLAPQPLLLAALAGGALARPGADDRGVAWRVGAGASARRWGLLMLAALTLSAALILPRGGSLWAGWFGPAAQSVRAEPRVTPPTFPPDPPQDSPLLESVRAMPEIRLPFQLGGQAPALPMELFLLVGLALVVALGALQWRLRGRAGPKATLVERLMVLGLALTAVAWLVASVLLSGSGGGSAGDQTARPDGVLPSTVLQELLGKFTSERIIDIGPLFTVLMTLSLLVMVGLVLMAWRLAQEVKASVPTLPVAETLESVDEPPGPLHRVRRAWQGAEGALLAAGQGRAESETPAGYAARLGLQFPLLSGPLRRLSAAYQPVRYGGQVTDDDADAAEAALADIRIRSADLTSADSPNPEGQP